MSVLAKMNVKDQKELVVLNAPESFEAVLTGLEGVAVHRKLAGVKRAAWMLGFATKQKEVDALVAAAVKKLDGDAMLWVAYPKKTSKKYRCEFDRDRGWEAAGAAGLEPVRMVAIDEDWSALRFRRVEFIKTITRSAKMALTAEAKARTTKKN